MKESYSIPLNGRVVGGGDMEFIEAEMSAKYDIPLAVVRYTLNGQKQQTGLRLDLDKQVFIDHFNGDTEKQKTLERAAPEIVKLVGAAPRISQ